jgi:hypothetical protein
MPGADQVNLGWLESGSVDASLRLTASGRFISNNLYALD